MCKTGFFCDRAEAFLAARHNDVVDGLVVVGRGSPTEHELRVHGVADLFGPPEYHYHRGNPRHYASLEAWWPQWVVEVTLAADAATQGGSVRYVFLRAFGNAGGTRRARCAAASTAFALGGAAAALTLIGEWWRADARVSETA